MLLNSNLEELEIINVFHNYQKCSLQILWVGKEIMINLMYQKIDRRHRLNRVQYNPYH